MAYNIITVGGLDMNLRRRGTSSNSNGVLPIKPDIVAPGQFVRGPSARDTNANTNLDDFNRVFLGDQYDDTAAGPDVGAITGTSFASPHVAGAAALLHDYRLQHGGDADHRVMKAVLLNAANTTAPKRNAGADWAQVITNQMTPTSSFTHPVVTQSLDTELGAGLLDAREAVRTYAAGEVQTSDNNALRNFVIDSTTNANGAGTMWDLERVGARSGGIDGTVDYLLDEILGGRHLRATLTWDSIANVGGGTDTLDPLELRLYHEGADDGNMAGFDSLNPMADDLITETLRVGENVKLLDLIVPQLPQTDTPGYYLQVANTSGTLTTYGIVIEVPEPTGLCCVLAAGGLTLMRRRRFAA
jgi:hypothetical protein